ncbi:hypothetical protein LTR62_002489 [Meristemomyces frigidus]|uniref:Uncharacterized protein n=1 Tax=Meristemomyces frigidus TaxID=1508187 RepID=A0AAN7YAU2_9PEZI|nr:hypothetical protein LTR62_002489 [Meristemomyces frigidus]
MESCVEQAEVMHHMFVLYGKTFNWSNMTYLVSYCVYTAATVDVAEMSSPDVTARSRAATRLGVALRLLEGEAKQTRSMRSSVDIIKRRLAADSNSEGHSRSKRRVVASRAEMPVSRIDNGEPLSRSLHLGLAMSGVDANPLNSGTLQAHANDDSLGIQEQVEQYDDTWDIVGFDLEAGFQPDSFAWDLDEDLHTSLTWPQYLPS